MSMNVPNEIDDAVVVAYSPIDDRHTATDDAKHYAAGQLTSTPTAFAICRYEDADAFYLFGCDPEWNVITDSCHMSLDDAKAQAEREYNGVSSTWESKQ
jgi:hypothetical protein